MRKLTLALAASLDGYIARENGSVDWLKMQDLTEAANESKQFFDSIDTIFFGRVTYEKGLALGGSFGDIKCFVFSRTLMETAAENTQIIAGDIKAFAERMKNQEGKNILLMGGGKIAQTFFENGLIDEIILGIQPVILGSGIPLFLPHRRQTELALAGVKTRKSGTVQITYRIKD